MDGIPDRATLRRRRYAVYRCTRCKNFHRSEPGKCQCGSRQFEMLLLKAADYCEIFGHNGSEMLVPGTERLERPSEFGIADKQRHRRVLSHQYRSYCARCGMQKTVRKVENLVACQALKPVF